MAQPLLAVSPCGQGNREAKAVTTGEAQPRVAVPQTPMSFYRRNLPHWHPEGATIFLTWRLCGSLPPQLTCSLEENHSGPAGKRFRAMDAKLDKAEYGPRWLEEEAVAGCVVQAIERGETALRQYIVRFRGDAQPRTPAHRAANSPGANNEWTQGGERTRCQ